MCDKIQTSKDGSVDLCHCKFAEFSSPRSIQQYSSNSSRKQRNYHGKDKSSHSKPGSGWSAKLDSSLDGRGSRPLRQFCTNGGGGSSAQNWRKQGQWEDKGNKEPGGWVKSRNCKDGEGGDIGRKKVPPTSLNHLLNFTVSSSERRYSGRGAMPPFVRHRRRNAHSYNKEEFLQANCQFVVSASGDYAIQSSDPDKLVEWDCIEQVRLFCHEIPSCPICLYPPRAAKITRCGHVYCWSCLLHYLSLGEKKWSKCPICNESIYSKDIKSVAALSSPQYVVGDTISMKLMIREKGTTRVYTRAEWSDQEHEMLTIEDSQVNLFVKLVSATPSQVLSCITGPEREVLMLQTAGLAEDEASELCFIEAALQNLELRESGLARSHAMGVEIAAEFPDTSQPSPLLSTDTSVTWTSFSDQYFEGGVLEHPFLDSEVVSTDSYHSVEEDDSQQAKEMTSVERSGETSPSSAGSPKSCSSENSSCGDPLPTRAIRGNLVYFYQASDGQHFYMHPINVKCLCKEYGGMEYCPDEITASVMEIEQFTMSEEVRGRYKSLNHLPLTCELALCEVELKAPILSQDTLNQFSSEIHRRRQKRSKKKKDERRREKRAEAKNPPPPEPTFRVPSAQELTPEKFHDFLSLASSPSLLDTGSPEATIKPCDGEGCGGNSSPQSFAQALQGGFPTWPVKASPKDAQTPHSAGVSVHTKEEGELLVPSFQDAFNEAFQTASESVFAATKDNGGKPGNKTAKKGRKKLVLFSTGGNRGAI